MSQTQETAVEQVRLFPSYDVEKKFGRKVGRLKYVALKAIEDANVGNDIHFLKFEDKGNFFALASRFDSNKNRLDIEIDFCAEGLTPYVITRSAHLKFEKRRKSSVQKDS